MGAFNIPRFEVGDTVKILVDIEPEDVQSGSIFEVVAVDYSTNSYILESFGMEDCDTTELADIPYYCLKKVIKPHVYSTLYRVVVTPGRLTDGVTVATYITMEDAIEYAKSYVKHSWPSYIEVQKVDFYARSDGSVCEDICTVYDDREKDND